MFALTPRLTLRPGWPEDAPALARAIGQWDVVKSLARAPWPYTLGDAAASLACPRGPHEPRFLILTRDGAAPALIGGVAISADHGAHELGYWLAPEVWGRGYATEAARAVIAMARHALPIDRLVARHHAANSASGRVLAKLGFIAAGAARSFSLAHGGEMDCVEYALDLAEADAAMPIAA